VLEFAVLFVVGALLVFVGTLNEVVDDDDDDTGGKVSSIFSSMKKKASFSFGLSFLYFLNASSDMFEIHSPRSKAMMLTSQSSGGR
jgi:hypothetical protein